MPPKYIETASPNFQQFLEYVIREQEASDENRILLLPDEKIDVDNTVHINSLVFSHRDDYVLAILRSDDMVNTTLLEDIVLRELNEDSDERYDNLKLAPSDQVVSLCGFRPGTVPPVGLSPRLVVVEQSLQGERRPLVGGGGLPHQSLQLPFSVLLEQENTVIGSFRRAQDDPVIGPHFETISFPKPCFVTAPPDTQLAIQIIRDSNQPNTLVPTFHTVVGQVGRVRRMARRLVFCDLLPIGSNETHPWKSPTDNQEMAVQLIAGKTLCQNRNDDRGDSLRALKTGMIVSVVAKTNVGNRDSLRNWVTQRSLDMVVFDYQALERKSEPVGEAKASPVAREPKQSTEPTLMLSELYKSSEPILVDNLETVTDFATTVRETQARLSGPDSFDLIGVDCEWKPKFLAGDTEPQPVLLLQVSIHSLERVYLLDVQSLLRPLLAPAHGKDAVEEVFNEAIGMLFSSTKYVKVGFQLSHDLQKLAASYPHIEALQYVHSVMDASLLAKKVMYINKERNSRIVTSSLSRLCQNFLGESLNKDQQTSDWSLRPLSESQKEYAALDAVVTPVIVDDLIKSCEARVFAKPEIGRWEGDSSFARLLNSYRFIFLDEEVEESAARKINAKSFVGHLRLVTQNWVTGSEEPSPPEPPRDGEYGTYTDTRGIVRVASKAVSIDETIKDSIIDGFVGKFVGKTKDRCLLPFLQGSAKLEEGAKLDFPQRSGFIEFDNMMALFVNLPVNPGRGRPNRFPNEWLEDGSILTWFIRENDWRQGSSSVAKKMLPSSNVLPTVVLYIRQGKGNFLCCGRCRCVILDNRQKEVGEDLQDWTLVKLHLLLLDWNRLNQSPDFRSMVDGRSPSVQSDDSDYDSGGE